MQETDKGTKTITFEVLLYGPIAAYGGGKHIANVNMTMSQGTPLGAVYAELGIPLKAKGYVFVNSVLCDAPGLNASLEYQVQADDHIGIFSDNHMWPYQYRDGVKMSDELRDVLRKTGAIHHSYESTARDE